MQGDFDHEDMEPERADQGEVVTLGFGKLLGLFLILVLVCGLCFGLGYFVGHRGVKSAIAAASTKGGAPETSQANGAIPKPSPTLLDASPVPQTATDAPQQNSVPGSP